MANPTVIDVYRPRIPTQVLGQPAGEEDADFLVVKIDLTGAGRRITRAQLNFADYAGLEAEWEAGTATTVLEAAVDSWMSAHGNDLEYLTAAQKSFIGYVPTVT